MNRKGLVLGLLIGITALVCIAAVFPEGDRPLANDQPQRSLVKINELLYGNGLGLPITIVGGMSSNIYSWGAGATPITTSPSGGLPVHITDPSTTNISVGPAVKITTIYPCLTNSSSVTVAGVPGNGYSYLFDIDLGASAALIDEIHYNIITNVPPDLVLLVFNAAPSTDPIGGAYQYANDADSKLLVDRIYTPSNNFYGVGPATTAQKCVTHTNFQNKIWVPTVGTLMKAKLIVGPQAFATLSNTNGVELIIKSRKAGL